jgi:tRNA pseudouridine13 synthase
MREAHPLERTVGMAWYVTDGEGTGGRLRVRPEDFRVREVESVDPEPPDADRGDYPHLLVRATLRSWDTNDFARELANRLEMSRERVAWAGTKDKRAVTTQLFSLDRVDPEATPEISGADLAVVGRLGRSLQFGDLAGNAFEITVREATSPGKATAIRSELETWHSGAGGAVPNYFGQQRFGSLRPVTHAVGLAVVRGDWEDAVLTYLAETSEHEPADTRAAREHVAETRDWQAGLDRFPKRLRYERAMLHALAAGDGFRDALETLPANLQRLLVNAAQSLLCNRMLSERLDRGLPFARPIAGDVACFAQERGGLTLPDTDRTQRVTERRVDAVTRHCERGRAFVTAPLVGTETELGAGVPGDIERAVLAAAGIEPADFDLPGEFHSEGTRRVIFLPVDPELEMGVGEEGGGGDGGPDADAFALSFTLPKGSYATIPLREFLKGSPLDL